MMPSSDQIASDSRPSSSRMRALTRQRPRGVDAPAERREDAEAPVADLVAEALDDDRAVARQDARGVLLLAQVVEEVLRRERRRGRSSRTSVAASCSTAQRLNAPIASPSSRGRPTRVAAPERHGARRARGGRDDDPVAADLLDPPRRRAEQERLPGAAPRRPSPRRARRRGGRRAASRRTGRGRGSCPRSAIASCRAPLRARIVSATRSHTMRARSSPNSCDG